MVDSEIIASIFPSIFIYVGTFLLIFIDSYITEEKRKHVYHILFLSLIYYISETSERLFIPLDCFYYGRLVFCVIDYCVAPVTILEFYYLVTKRKKHDKLLWILPGIQSALFIYSLFSQLFDELPNLGLEFTRNNQYDYGLLYSISVLIPVTIGVLGINSTVLEYKRKNAALYELVVVCFLVTGNLIAWVTESFVTGIKLVGITAFISVDIYYAFLYIHYFRIHEDEVLKKYEVEVMVSQIHPHFIYNTLNSIYHLCGKNDDLAKKTIDDFSTYLRRNLKSLSSTSFITIEEEINHTKTYLSIEKLRFGDRLNYNFDINCEPFKVPPLILQPIVENAVKHGICEKEEGGTVNIRVYREKDKRIIEVIDDGVGFDSQAYNFDGENHIGFYNTKERVEKLLCGTLKIESNEGSGTKVVITF